MEHHFQAAGEKVLHSIIVSKNFPSAVELEKNQLGLGFRHVQCAKIEVLFGIVVGSVI